MGNLVAPFTWVGRQWIKPRIDSWLEKGWHPARVVWLVIAGIGSAVAAIGYFRHPHRPGAVWWLLALSVVVILWLLTEVVRWRVRHNRLEKQLKLNETPPPPPADDSVSAAASPPDPLPTPANPKPPPGPAVRAVLTFTPPSHQYPPELPMTEAQHEAVLTSRFSVKSEAVTFNMEGDTLTVGMRFKNIGPTIARWELTAFRVTVNGVFHPNVIRLTRRNTLAGGEEMTYNGPPFEHPDLTSEAKGTVEFRMLHGPPQRPRAFWFEEIWNFTITPSGDGTTFKTRGYRLRDSEGESEPSLP